MFFWQSLAGMLEVRITGASPERSLEAAVQKKIPLYKVCRESDLEYRFWIPRAEYSCLVHLLEKQGDRLEIINKRGIIWKINSLFRRWVLIASLFILLLSSLYLPSRIFFIRVEGNQTIPTNIILNAAENCGIHFGASRKTIRSEKVKNALLTAVPQLQWAGINTSGCVAVISVRERKEEPQEIENNSVSNLIAERDAYILSGTVISGTALFQPGETVTKGQILISGYTDCGICIQAGRAEGEILAQTNRSLRAVMPENCSSRGRILDVKRQFSLIIRKKRINLWKDSRISDMDCGRMYEEYFVSLPGGFQLPIAFCIDQYVYFDKEASSIPETKSQMQLQKFSDEYLLQQMVAGQIIEKQQKAVSSDGLHVLESSYACTEIIGKEQREQIGDINGKRN